jgi:hypothetical protein
LKFIFYKVGTRREDEERGRGEGGGEGVRGEDEEGGRAGELGGNGGGHTKFGRWELFSEQIPYADNKIFGIQVIYPVIQGKRPTLTLLEECPALVLGMTNEGSG